MEITAITEFFKWCTIINGVLLLFSSLMSIFIRDLAFRIHSQWFHISQETFDKEIFNFLGNCKVIFIYFNLTPYLTLLIIS
jgi:hypothetical protein